MRRIALYSAGVFLFGIDRIFKILSNTLTTDQRIVGEAVVFTHVENTGVAWGIPVSGTWAFIVPALALLTVMALLIKGFQKRQTIVEFGWVLVWLGAFSNLLDRVLYGAVVDYLRPLVGPTMNIADIMITVGVVLACAGYAMRKRPIEKHRA